MIRLLLILLGAEIVRQQWFRIGLAGLAWAGLGIFIFVDALDDDTLIPLEGLGGLIVLEGVLAAVAGLFSTGTVRRLRYAKGLGLLLVGCLTIEGSDHSNAMLALLIGLGFAADGLLKVAAARVIRFRGWRAIQAQGLLGLLLAVLTLQPWPTWYVGTIGCNLGIALLLTGCNAIAIAKRLRRLPPDASVSDLLSRARVSRPDRLRGRGQAGGREMVVHVWTPVATATSGEAGQGVSRRPLVDRYIAAVDECGTVFTGHAALELGPDIYVSHYPEAEIDRSARDFGAMLRGTRDNDVPGRFQPSYGVEAAGWCEATTHVRFSRFDAVRLREFWDQYRSDATYNLTSRNCSSAVAAALDAALEGVLAEQWASRRYRWPTLARAVLSPELWVATLLRKRAESMAWTPGLVLDYARALSAVVDPPAAAWPAIAARLARRQRRPRPALHTPNRTTTAPGPVARRAQEHPPSR